MAKKLYPRPLIAAVKAACFAGLPWKLVAKLSGVPYHTLRYWAMNKIHRDVKPDPQFAMRFEHFGRRVFLLPVKRP